MQFERMLSVVHESLNTHHQMIVSTVEQNETEITVAASGNEQTLRQSRMVCAVSLHGDRTTT